MWNLALCAVVVALVACVAQAEIAIVVGLCAVLWHCCTCDDVVTPKRGTRPARKSTNVATAPTSTVSACAPVATPTVVQRVASFPSILTPPTVDEEHVLDEILRKKKEARGRVPDNRAYYTSALPKFVASAAADLTTIDPAIRVFDAPPRVHSLGEI